MNWLHNLTEHYRSDPDLADVFGIILYTDEHPYIKKVLKDDDFWLALDEISGTEWVIFSIKPKKTSPNKSSIKRKPGALYKMISIDKEPVENKELLDYLGINSSCRLPLLVLYTHDEDGEILKIEWKIDEESKDSTYNSLRRGIQLIRQAVDGVHDENKKYSEGVFRAIEMAVDRDIKIQRIKKLTTLYIQIKSLIK